MAGIVLLKRVLCLVLVGSFVLLSPAAAQAGLVSTEALLQDSARDRVQALLERDEVRAQLEAHGIGADEARLRVAALSDAEIAAIDQRIDSLPAGAGLGWLGVVALVAVALALTDYFGVTNVYPWIKERDQARDRRY